MLKLKPRKTVDDYMRLPEGTFAELIEGEIFVTPSPGFDHQQVIGELFVALREYVRSREAGALAMAPLDVYLPSGDVVQPDLVFVATGNRSAIQQWVRGVPDLLVEVVSADRPERDRIVKRDLYARNGVPEYWIVDPETRSVEVLVIESGRYVPHGYFEAGDSLTSRSLPGFALPLEGVFGKR
jgi:Uma2 family endonuclease